MTMAWYNRIAERNIRYAAVIDERPGDPIIFDPARNGKAL